MSHNALCGLGRRETEVFACVAIGRVWLRIPGQGGHDSEIIPGAFRNDAGHDSGMKPVTDSDFKPVTSGSRSEPDRDHFGEISTGRRTLDNNASEQGLGFRVE